MFPVNKTIRWELRPIGATAKTMKECGFLDRDRSRKDSYSIVKDMADRYYRSFIDRKLSVVNVDWKALGTAMDMAKDRGEAKDKKELENLKKTLKTEISEQMYSKKDDGDLFSAEILAKLKGTESDDEESRALDEFNRFAGYFQDYFVNRKVFTDTVRGSCAYRIVEDNFPRHYENCKKYATISKDNPDLIRELRGAMGDHLVVDPDTMFQIGYFSNLLRQKDIDAYNRIIGSVFRSESDVDAGFNSILNEHHQRNPDAPKYLMQKLYRQILFEPESGSYRPRNYENEIQMFEDLNSLWTRMETNRILDQPIEVLKGNFDASKVFVTKAGVNTLSRWMYPDWEHIGGLLQIYKMEEMGDSASKSRKRIDKWLDSKCFSLDVIGKATGRDPQTEVAGFIIEELSKTAGQIRVAYAGLDGCASMKPDEYTPRVKSFVDALLRYRDVLKIFYYDDDLGSDREFYDTFQYVYEELAEAYRVYNLCRNFITRKPYSTDKFRMSFDCPHLADGWDLNKEKDYNSFLFRRDGLYYMGVRNPRSKPLDFQSIEDPGCEVYYEKVVYKQLPDPKKMLPKVFLVSKKGRKTYTPSERILQGYAEGRHRQDGPFDLRFCHELIDFYKDAISRNEDWRFFGFSFKDTEEYNSIAEFYEDVESQGYRVRFIRIPAESIDSMVSEGRLLLFQMYNKDYSRSKTPGGTPNLHTMYWEAALSEKNLADVNVKINGYAELFWRDASIEKPVVHRKGSVLVNRIGKDGKPIPDKAYYDLCRYCNGIVKELSAGKDYADRIVTKEAEYDVEKDRRYCHDRMFLHIPLTFNFKCAGKADVNRMVIDWIRSDRDMKFLGIDRGERNLLYLSLVDSGGKIVWQKSLNTILQRDGRGGIREIDYHQKLVSKEKDREMARATWGQMDAIKNLKEGYVSAAVHEICRIAVEENALIVIENLNYGFKNSRKKVERQTYQTFERMLISKLQHLVFKDVPTDGPGSVLQPYQLCGPVDSLKDIPSHCGILVHVTAAYTSHIDPVTGFVNVFNLSDITNDDRRKEFLSKMASIRYNTDEDVFEFSFDYGDFKTRLTPKVRKWTVCTYGDRIIYDNKSNTRHRIHPTEEIKEALSKAGIRYLDGSDIRSEIVASGTSTKVYRALVAALNLRVTDTDSDMVVSPVRDASGRHFVSGSADDLPLDADANGAFCIAMKGLLLAEKIRNSDGNRLPTVSNNEWVDFMQGRAV